MKLFEKIRILRKARGLSQEQLGYSLSRVNKDGISRQTISDWENGNFEPKLENIRDLAEVFDVSFDALLDESIDLNDENVLNKILNNSQKVERAQPVVNNKKSTVKARDILLFIVTSILIVFSLNTLISYTSQLIALGASSNNNIGLFLLFMFLELGVLAISGVALGLLINATIRGKSVKVVGILLIIAIVIYLGHSVGTGIQIIKSYSDSMRKYNIPEYKKMIAYNVAILVYNILECTTFAALVILSLTAFNKSKPQVGPELHK